ncbi:MAG: hypothetical protein ACRCUB_15535 [Plesiomonas shigelloides]
MTDNQELLSTLDHLSSMKDDEISGGVVLVGSCLPVKIQAAAASAAGVIRKQSASASTLQYRLDRAERALTRHGFEDHGAAEWKPPLGPSAIPDIDLFDDLHDLCVFVDSPGGPQDGAAIWEQMLKIKAAWQEKKAPTLTLSASHSRDDVIALSNAAKSNPVILPADIEPVGRKFSAVTKGFMTSNSGGPDGYCLKIQYKTLEELHAAFREMIPVFNADDKSGIEWNYEDNAEPEPTPQDYRELQAQHDQLQSQYKKAMDVLKSAVQTSEFERQPLRPWHAFAKAVLDGKESAISDESSIVEQPVTMVPECWCHTCRPVTISDMRFVVCPTCGNKRCPRAKDHRNACSFSNEPAADETSSLLASAQELVSRADKLCADVAAGKGGRVLSTAELDEIVTVLQSIAGGVTSNPAHDARVLLGKLSGTIPGLGQSFSEGAE